jgi:photosystem II stability/assembly factor-like uncharacterized protein
MRVAAGVWVWLALGLPAAAGWKALGPFGGAASVVAVDGRDPGTVYAGAENALLFRSGDGGQNWEPLTFPARLRAELHAFALDPRREGLCFAGVASSTAAFSGIFRSRDGGRTWESLPGMAGRRVWSMAVWVYDSRIIAAGTQDGVYLTRNSGDAWVRISPATNRELQPVVSLAFHPGDCRVIYAGTPHLPWKTRDGGVTWRSVHSGMLDDSDVFSIQVDPAEPERVFASACSGIYRSLDGGARWTRLHGARDASYRTYVVAQDPANRKTVFAGTSRGLTRSTDGGLTWRKLLPQATRAIAFDPRHRGRIFVASGEAGILRSDDGGATFHESNRGLVNDHFTFLAAAGQAWYTAAINEASGGGLFRLAAGGRQFERVAQLGRIFAVAPGADGKLYAAADRGVLVSADAGKSWKLLARPAGAARLTSLAALGGRVLAGADNGLFRGERAGTEWVRVTPVPARATHVVQLAGGRVAAIAGNWVFTSADGAVWTPWRAVEGEVFGLESGAGEALLAATTLGVWRAAGPREDWRPLPGELGRNSVRAIRRHPSQPQLLAAATYETVYTSRDGGSTWAKTSNAEVPVGPITALAFRGERLLLLTQRQGVFEIE